MFDAILQGLGTTILIVVVLGLTFVAWIIWNIRESLANLFRVIGEQWEKSKTNDYTHDELKYNVRYWEERGKPRIAATWQRLLDEKYPDEPSS